MIRFVLAFCCMVIVRVLHAEAADPTPPVASPGTPPVAECGIGLTEEAQKKFECDYQKDVLKPMAALEFERNEVFLRAESRRLRQLDRRLRHCAVAPQGWACMTMDVFKRSRTFDARLVTIRGDRILAICATEVLQYFLLFDRSETSRVAKCAAGKKLTFTGSWARLPDRSETKRVAECAVGTGSWARLRSVEKFHSSLGQPTFIVVVSDLVSCDERK
jgi:hypothetical protein